MEKTLEKYDRIVLTFLALYDFVVLVILHASWSVATLLYLLLNWIFLWSRKNFDAI